MASHKSTTKDRARNAVVLATATVGSIALLPSIAEADPTQNVKDVKAKVDELHKEAEQAAEAYNASNAQLTALQHKVDQIQGRITQEQQLLSQAQSALGNLAAAQYKSGGVDSTLQLMLSTSPDAYLQQATTLANISTRQAGALVNAEEIQRQLTQDKSTAATELAQLQKTRDLAAQQKADVLGKEKAAQALLNRLTPPQRAQYNGMAHAGGVTSSDIANLPVPTDKRAAIAVAFAEAQVGKPYLWAAAGPNAFDCSGLTMVAWGKAGVSMEHGSRSQYASFPKVSRSQLQPGDLVFYYSDLHHVGMYVGNNTIVHAANSSTPIQYAPMDEMPIMGYVRP